ncbi:MAG: IS3 family transposase [bacterium]
MRGFVTRQITLEQVALKSPVFGVKMQNSKKSLVNYRLNVSEQKKIHLARERMNRCKNKAELARKMKISRGSLYYRPKKPSEDKELKTQILSVLGNHPAYGHKRIAIELKINKKRILRVMNIFSIRPRIMRGKPTKPEDRGNLPTKTPNVAKTICPIASNVLWVGDFTYLPWHGGFVYVATVLDVYTREIIGWHIGLRHTTDLVVRAFIDAMKRTGTRPQIFHSDQGSEYVSGEYEKLLKNLNVIPSNSKKSCPWENGYQESFYSGFKLELGNPKQYITLGELIEAIHRQICYYNQNRIHTSLKMPPERFRLQYLAKQKTTIKVI